MKSIFSGLKHVLLAIAVTICGTASATTVVLDSTNQNNTIVLNLAAGTYDVNYLSGAWTPWSAVVDCDQNGMNCVNGWVNSYFYAVDSGGSWHGDGNRYATAALAEAAGITSLSMQIVLTQAGTLMFALPDSFYPDNSGSISLSVTAVPEPAEFMMFLGGISMLGLVMRRRNATRTS